jgi:hypothetical protein
VSQVGQWFIIAGRERPRIADFARKEELAERLTAFVRGWNEIAHPFNRASKSAAKVMAKCQAEEMQPFATAA